MGSIYIAGNRIVPAQGYVATPFGHLQRRAVDDHRI